MLIYLKKLIKCKKKLFRKKEIKEASFNQIIYQKEKNEKSSRKKVPRYRSFS